jgi:peptide/nickel transport system substrate-binding protein/oligopeptide transport system substrate-binding protein
MAGFLFTRRTIIAAVAACGLLVPAIGPAQAHTAASNAKSSEVLIYPNEPNSSLWVNTLDPALASDTQSGEAINLLYSGLVKLDGKNNVVPDLAAAMPTVSADHLTYTFKLRPNLKFSDGTPVVASDVVYSITRALSKAEASGLAPTYLGHIVGAAALNAGKTTVLSGMSAPDDGTVVFKLDKPISFFLETLTYPTADVVKPTLKAGVQMAGPNDQALNIGTGPFMFSRAWRYRSEMYFKPNPYWYGASKMKLAEIDMPFIASDTTSYAEYQSGQTPITTIPPASRAAATSLPDYHSGPLLAIDYIIPNLGPNAACKPLSCAPFNDLHFRRALMYAVDRNTIDNVVLHGAQKPLCSFIPVGIAGTDDKDLCPLNSYNPTRAKAELALAKKDFGGKLPNDGNYTVVYQAGLQGLANEYVELQNEWAAIGININITSTPYNNWLTLVTHNYTPFVEALWYDDYPDGQDFMENLLASYAYYDIGNFKSPQYDKLISEANVTPNGPDRTKLYVEAQKIAIANAAYIMVGQVYSQFRWKSNIHGLYNSSSFQFPQPANQDWTNVSVS